MEFEVLPEVCFSCGKYGHLKDLCPSSLTDWSGHGGIEIPKSPLNSETAPVMKMDALPMVGEAFGPWMVVERKSRRKQEGIRGQKAKISDGNSAGSRFEKLSTLAHESLTQELEAPSGVIERY